MTTTLAFSFPWGRYHANPWGHQVNEAKVEWPPSPWRILRALYATWQNRLPALDAEAVLAVLGQLAEPPCYWLPPSGRAHSRHYMPDTKEDRAKAFDTFEVLEKGADLVVRWPATLDPGQSAPLAELAGALPYLGRAESICLARVLEDGPQPAGRPWLPFEAGPGSSQGSAFGSGAVSLLVPLRPLDLETLTVRTLDLQARRVVDPPGTRWMAYSSSGPVDEEDKDGARSAHVRRSAQPGELRGGRPASYRSPTAVRWAITTPARPALKAAVVMADVLRHACMSRYGRAHGGAASPILAGKDVAGHPLKGHGHAHYLAWDTDGDGLLDVLVLWAPTGLDEGEMEALGGLRELSGFSHLADFRPCRLGLEALGQVDDVAPGLVGPASRWVSHTPFAAPRHAKGDERGGRPQWPDFVEREVRRELRARGKPEPSRVRLSDARHDWLDFRRHRAKERLSDARSATGIQVEFPEPVTGPLALGALSHFGLGLLVAGRR